MESKYESNCPRLSYKNSRSELISVRFGIAAPWSDRDIVLSFVVNLVINDILAYDTPVRTETINCG